MQKWISLGSVADEIDLPIPAQWLSGIVAGFFTEKSAGDDDHQDIKQEEPFSSKKQERRSPMLMK